MGCAYSAHRKPEVMKGRIQPIDSDIRAEAHAGRASDQPRNVNNLRGVSIKSQYPRDDVIPGFT